MKKIFILFLMAFATYAHAQECDQYTKVVRDDMTDDSYVAMTELIITKTTTGKEAVIDAFIVDGTVVVSVEVDGVFGCVEEKSDVIILMMDGTKLRLEHMGKFNCKGRSVLYLDSRFGTQNSLQTLSTVGVKKIRVYNSENYNEVEVNELDSALLMNGIKCLSEHE